MTSSPSRSPVTDDQIAEMHAGGMTYAQIGEAIGASGNWAYERAERARGRGHNAIHDDIRFVKAGSQPVEHRDTGKGGVEAFKTDAAGWFHVEPTTIDECADLLKEWGAS